MTAKYEDRIEKLQSGKVSYLEFVMEGEYKSSYIQWCEEHLVEPTDETAAQFIDEIEYDMFEFQSNSDLHGFFSL